MSGCECESLGFSTWPLGTRRSRDGWGREYSTVSGSSWGRKHAGSGWDARREAIEGFKGRMVSAQGLGDLGHEWSQARDSAMPGRPTAWWESCRWDGGKG